MHTPRSTLASWGGAGGALLEPLFEWPRRFIFGCRVLHADETPLPLLDPGAGKTKKVYVGALARSHHDPHPDLVHEFCLGRGAQYPVAFLGAKGPPSPEAAWNGTLMTDPYAGYNGVLDAKAYPQRQSAACAAHARRCFEDMSCSGNSVSAAAIDNNLSEPQTEPWQLGAQNRLFTGSALAGQRAAVVMSLVQSAKLNGFDPWAYPRDVLGRINDHPNKRIEALLPHRWRPPGSSQTP